MREGLEEGTGRSLETDAFDPVDLVVKGIGCAFQLAPLLRIKVLAPSVQTTDLLLQKLRELLMAVRHGEERGKQTLMRPDRLQFAGDALCELARWLS